MQELAWAIIFVPAIWHAIHHSLVRVCLLLCSRLFQLHPKVNRGNVIMERQKRYVVEKDERENRDQTVGSRNKGEGEGEKKGGCVRYFEKARPPKVERRAWRRTRSKKNWTSVLPLVSVGSLTRASFFSSLFDHGVDVCLFWLSLDLKWFSHDTLNAWKKTRKKQLRCGCKTACSLSFVDIYY